MPRRKQMTRELIEQHEMEQYQMALDLQDVVKSLIADMRSGETKMSGTLLREATQTLKALSALLFNIKLELERKKALEAKEAELIDGMSPEEKAMLDEWEEEGADEYGNLNPTPKPKDAPLTVDSLDRGHVLDTDSYGLGQHGGRL